MRAQRTEQAEFSRQLENGPDVAGDSYYELGVARPPPFPPLAGRVAADVCVIGGGYAGLSAALELATRGYSVALLEAHRIGWGASGRNGGQALVGFGSAGESAIEAQLCAADARRAWDVTVEGLELLRERIERYAIACDYRPGYLSVAAGARKSPALRAWADHVVRAYGYPLEWIGPAEIGRWIASERFHSGVFDSRSGHLHPLKYCLGLAAAAHGAGVRMFEGSKARSIDRGPNPLVRTAAGELACRFVVLAGNAYLGDWGDAVAPELAGRIMPVSTYMIATEPMGKARADALIRQCAAVSDTNFVLDYFRLSADRRLLFGAGESVRAGTPRKLVVIVRKRMLNVFPQLADLAVTHAWGGLVDVTMNKAPDFGRLDGNIYYVQGFSGHGLVLAAMAGRLVAEAIAGRPGRFDLFTRIRHHRFPGGKLMRAPLLMLGMGYYRLRDRF
jgi:gamma-glutamylputrescine oxidase